MSIPQNVEPSYRQTRTLLFAGITITLWASAFPAIRVGLQAFSPVHVALLRYLVAALVLAGYAAITRMPLPRRADVPGLALGPMVEHLMLWSGH